MALKSNPLFKFLSSLKLAVLCLLSLAAVLATATVLESLYGMRAAHVLVYGTWWFYTLLFVLGTNVLCAALSRYPWKKRQTGFVITHLGILTILFGSYLTMKLGVDGNLPIYEGSEDSEVILNKLTLTVTDEEERLAQSFPVPETAVLSKGRLMEVNLPGNERLVVDEFIPRAVAERSVLASPLKGVGSPALKIEVFNSRFNVQEWLFLPNPEKPVELALGPAQLSFQKLWTSEAESKFLDAKPEPASKLRAMGYLNIEYQGRQFRIDVADSLKKWIRIGSTPFEVQVDRYMPYAVVENNELVNRSQEPVNPAVQLRLANASAQQERHTIFANFPDFSTRHKTPTPQDPFDVRIQFIAASAENHNRMGQARGELRFAQSADDGRLLYQVRGSAGKVNGKGEVKVGEEVATGWMDLKFKVTEWFPAAIEQEVPHYVEFIQGGDANFLTGVKLVRESSRGPSSSASNEESSWLLEGSRKTLSVGNKKLVVRYGKEKLTLPFRIFLEKFKIGNDPGTSKAATYESQVTVRDSVKGVEQKALISMNEPVQYGGYTFYQASYQLQEGSPPVSVFSVNYDPGRVVKYLGSIIMVLGILLMFYMNPHYWDKLLSPKRKTS